MGILIALGLACVVWAVVAAVLIAHDLHRRGASVSFVWLRLMILRYLHEYAAPAADPRVNRSGEYR